MFLSVVSGLLNFASPLEMVSFQAGVHGATPTTSQRREPSGVPSVMSAAPSGFSGISLSSRMLLNALQPDVQFLEVSLSYIGSKAKRKPKASGLPPPDLGSFSGWDMTAHLFASSQSLRCRVEGYSEHRHSGCSSHLKNAQLQMGATTQRGKSVERHPFSLLSYSSLLPIITLHLKVVNFTLERAWLLSQVEGVRSLHHW